MSTRPESDWTQVGWKAWYHDGVSMTVYSSKTDTWTSLPTEGLQFMYRYYSSNTSSWKEGIYGDDLYTECTDDLLGIVANSPECKVGSDKAHSEVRDDLDAARNASNIPINNTLASYTNPSKVLQNWTLFYEDGSTASSAAGDVWENVPQDKVILLFREMTDGTDTWIEQVYNTDLYVKGAVDEISLVSNNNKIKRGRVISDQHLADVLSAAKTDQEEF